MKTEHVRSILGCLLRIKGNVEAVASSMIALACQEGECSCEYCGIPLSATPTSTVSDISRFFSAECIRRGHMPLSGRLQLKSLGLL
jgi:hypothetical protein